MPLLGIFSKKSKAQRVADRNALATTSTHNSATSDIDSALSSPTTEYISADKALPSSPNGRSTLHPYDAAGMSASSTSMSPLVKRGLFGRKKTANPNSASTSTVNVQPVNGKDFHTAPRPAYMARLSTGASSETDAADLRRLGPPPSRSAVFAAYNDPQNALSTRSLPNARSTSDKSLPSTPPPPLPTTSRKSSFFNWSNKSQNGAVPKSPEQKLTSANTSAEVSPRPTADLSSSSFNLKSFRHVRPPSPSNASPNASVVSLSQISPRPRRASVASESSQRMTVAAFREAQARRSQAGSPAPSFRSPSPGPHLNIPPPLPHIDVNRSRPPLPQQRPQQQRRSTVNMSPSRPKSRTGSARLSAAVSSVFDSDESASPSEEEDSDDDKPLKRGPADVVRRRTLTQRTKSEGVVNSRGRATRSELGHGSSRHPEAPPMPRSSRASSTLGMSPTAGRPQPKISIGVSSPSSGMSPSSTTQRSSFVSSPMSDASQPRKSLHIRETSSSDSEDSDNAPLATLIAPRRPGSAMSNASHPSPKLAPKPLIDINELTAPTKKPTGGDYFSGPSDGFTLGATLISGNANPKHKSSLGSSSNSHSSSSATSPVITSKSPPGGRFISPPSSPNHHPLDPKSNVVSSVASSAHPSPRTMPLRRDTDSSMVLTAATGELGRKRDVLGERLSRVVQMNAGTSGNGTGNGNGNAGGKRATSPASSSGGTGTVDDDHKVLQEKEKENHGKGVAKVVAKATTPSPASTTTAKPRLSHRKSHSDVVFSSSKTHPHQRSVDENMEDLASMLGAGVKLISRNGEEEEEEEEQSRDEEESDAPSPTRIAPIVIKRRAPTPSFSVTSRPQQPRSSGTFSLYGNGNTSDEADASPRHNLPRQRSSTLIPGSTSSSTFTIPTASVRPSISPKVSSSPKASPKASASPPSSTATSNADRSKLLTKSPRQQQQRSSTIMPLVSIPPSPGLTLFPTPPKPFATPRESPASSTGDSSSGRAPLTPRDGSDIGSGSASNSGVRVRSDDGSKHEKQWSGGVSGLGLHGAHAKRRSVSFDEEAAKSVNGGKGKGKETPMDGETRRRERRRSEAKAAIELGNVINGRGPIVEDEDDDDDDRPINQTLARMSTMNPMMGNPMQMGFNPPQNGGQAWNNMAAWQQMQTPQMVTPSQFMLPPPTDPNFFAAHQQAMMIAKQAYQMAVAQQAMMAAGDEWERGSSVGYAGGGGGSVYGGSASVYGGSTTSPSMMGSPFGMNMGGNGGWGTPSMLFPPGPRSMYGGGAQSEYGGSGGGGGNWNSSRSVYGESFGPSTDRPRKSTAGQGGGKTRDSGYFPPMPSMPQGQSNGTSRGPDRRSRTFSQPTSPQPNRTAPVRRAPPPSSWKAGV